MQLKRVHIKFHMSTYHLADEDVIYPWVIRYQYKIGKDTYYGQSHWFTSTMNFSGKRTFWMNMSMTPKLRESYILDTLECGEASFAMACLLANRKYRQEATTRHMTSKKSPSYTRSSCRTQQESAMAEQLALTSWKRHRPCGLNSSAKQTSVPGHPAESSCTQPGRTQPFGNISMSSSTRDRQRPDTRSGAQALYAKAP